MAHSTWGNKDVGIEKQAQTGGSRGPHVSLNLEREAGRREVPDRDFSLFFFFFF